MIVLIFAVIGKVFTLDALMSVFFFGMIAAVCLLVWLLCTLDPRTVRWIDIASPVRLPFLGAGRGSDARLIEEQIAERERRLTALGLIEA